MGKGVGDQTNLQMPLKELTKVWSLEFER